jgi:hypothetical protein
MIWNLQNITGTKDAVKSKIAAEKVPAEVKAFLTATIDANAEGLFIVNAYKQDVRKDNVKTTQIIQFTVERYGV